MPRKPIPLLDRFNTKYIIQDNGCWIWTGHCVKGGYGVICIAVNTNQYAHRVSYELFIGTVPLELKVLHTCDNPACVNPSHLFIGSQQDNMTDKTIKQRQDKGTGRWNNVLTEEQVHTIRNTIPSKGYQTKLAKQYNVYPGTICDIIHRKTWKHL